MMESFYHIHKDSIMLVQLCHSPWLGSVTRSRYLQCTLKNYFGIHFAAVGIKNSVFMSIT